VGRNVLLQKAALPDELVHFDLCFPLEIFIYLKQAISGPVNIRLSDQLVYLAFLRRKLERLCLDVFLWKYKQWFAILAEH